MQHKNKNIVTQEGPRVVKHSGRAYRKVTATRRSHRGMTIHPIGGQEVRFGQYFRRYREFTSLNWCMLLLCYHYVVFIAFNTQVMRLQRSGVMWILWLSVCFIIIQRSCVMLILCFYVYFMLLCCYGSQYILCFYKEKLSRYYYTFKQKHIFNGLTTVLDFGNHKDMLCWIYDKNVSITFIFWTVTKKVRKF